MVGDVRKATLNLLATEFVDAARVNEAGEIDRLTGTGISPIL